MIAKTILEQIGGRRFAAMTGSKDFTDMGNGLRMSLARNKTSANRLDIIYDGGADLYNMRFYIIDDVRLPSARFMVSSPVCAPLSAVAIPSAVLNVPVSNNPSSV